MAEPAPEYGRRRVVTGLDAEGRSCVIVDGPTLPLASASRLVWRTEGALADNSGADDCSPADFGFDLMQAGSLFMITTFAPGMGSFWHATDTVDYIVMLTGEVVLELEAGEVRLRAGDVLVDRGVRHSWRNDGPEPATAAIVTVPASPVGAGRTV